MSLSKLDEAVDKYEAMDLVVIRESDLVHRLSQISRVVYGNVYAPPDYELVENYINSPWRKITRLGKIASGTKKEAAHYYTMSPITNVHAFNQNGVERTLSNVSGGVSLSDYKNDYYTLHIEVEFDYTVGQGESPDVCDVYIDNTEFSIADRWSSVLTATPIPILAENKIPTHQAPCTVLFPSESGPIRLRFSTPAATSFKYGMVVYFHRPKGTFEIEVPTSTSVPQPQENYFKPAPVQTGETYYGPSSGGTGSGYSPNGP